MMIELFQQALHINAPWLIKSIDFNAEEKRLDIQIDFNRSVNPDTLPSQGVGMSRTFPSSRFILGTRACK
jgi:hypothetical protein